jgi:O-acetylhomoserine/O-acetylserine sulfhydrylase-like pyridoxal-dependent enzyme
MANAQAMCTSFKQDLLNGLHAFGSSVVRAATTPDVFKAALYLASGSQGAGTTAYSATNEVSGTGYTAGGVVVTTGTTPTTSGTTAYVTPSASIVYSGVTLTTSFDCVTIYNNTAAGKNAVSVHTFTAQTITAGTLTLTMPTNDSTNALIRLA